MSVTSKPSRANRVAVVEPAGPPPTTRTWVFEFMFSPSHFWRGNSGTSRLYWPSTWLLQSGKRHVTNVPLYFPKRPKRWMPYSLSTGHTSKLKMNVSVNPGGHYKPSVPDLTKEYHICGSVSVTPVTKKGVFLHTGVQLLKRETARSTE